jgi:predicted transcriptional regulator
MSTPVQTPSRAELLKRLREQHSASVARTQALYKEQRRIQQEIRGCIRETPKTVPEIGAALSLPTHEILWHLMAMKKYGLVVENGMSGDYPLYQQVKEEQA